MSSDLIVQRVPLREVWKHEAVDFTTWLDSNFDVPDEALDLSLVSDDRTSAFAGKMPGAGMVIDASP